MYQKILLCSGLVIMGCQHAPQSHNTHTITTFNEQQMIDVSGEAFLRLYNTKSMDEGRVSPFINLEELCSRYAPHLAPSKNKNRFTDAMREGFYSRFKPMMKTEYDKEAYMNMSVNFVSVAFDICESAYQRGQA